MRSNADAYSIDANVILRYLRKDHPELSPRAFEILSAVEDGEATVICDPVNLGEVIWVLRSRYGLSNEEIVEGLEPIFEMDGFVMPNKERYHLALRFFATEIRHFGDACACAAAIQDCDGRLYSFDKKLSRVPGITRSERVP